MDLKQTSKISDTMVVRRWWNKIIIFKLVKEPRQNCRRLLGKGSVLSGRKFPMSNTDRMGYQKAALATWLQPIPCLRDPKSWSNQLMKSQSLWNISTRLHIIFYVGIRLTVWLIIDAVSYHGGTIQRLSPANALLMLLLLLLLALGTFFLLDLVLGRFVVLYLFSLSSQHRWKLFLANG